jgi:UDP-N-acetylmuramate dehydrogenase
METPVETRARIATWFGVGGGATRFAEPSTLDDVRALVRSEPTLKVVGDGANLLVADQGVRGLVVSLARMRQVDWDLGETGDGRVRVRVEAGHSLPKLINESVRRGLGGIETLGGIPATVGGAAIMNAGGKFGSFADVVTRVFAVTRTGAVVTLERDQIAFGYRTSGLADLIVTGVEIALTRGDPVALRDRLKQVMEYKSASQPLRDSSAGCCFKNPVLTRDIEGVGRAGERVSAGMLIDRAGLKRTRVGTAEVSDVHANFLTVRPAPEGRADDVVALLRVVMAGVEAAFGVRLEPEVVVWGVDNWECHP